MTPVNRFPHRPVRPLLALVLLFALAGCRTLDSKMTGTWWPIPDRLAKDDRKQARGNDETINNVAGPTERRLKAKEWSENREKMSERGSAEEQRHLGIYKEGERLFAKRQFTEAEKLFREVAKARRKSYETFYDRVLNFWGVGQGNFDPYKQFGDPLEEDSLYYVAECEFAQRKYAKAQDSYEDLLTRYPSTTHLDRVTRQLFRIARYWLDFDESIGANGDVKQVNLEEQRKTLKIHQPERDYFFLVPNWADSTRPVFDTRGRALQALKSIWLHDATGPLSDDALMLSAAYRLKSGDYQEASRLYKLLREQYPDSPHLENAYILGGEVTMASYQGAKYDGVVLSDARNLKQQTLAGFAQKLAPEEKERLQKELKRMAHEEVARMWAKVEYYQAKRQRESIELYCHLLVNQYPESPYAERCRKILAKNQNVEYADASRNVPGQQMREDLIEPEEARSKNKSSSPPPAASQPPRLLKFFGAGSKPVPSAEKTAQKPEPAPAAAPAGPKVTPGEFEGEGTIFQ